MMAQEQSEDEERYVDFLTTENGTEVEVGVYNSRQEIRSDQKGHVCVPFVDHRAIDYIAAQIREMIEDRYDCIVMLTGRRRIGKSNLGLQIARKVDPKFTLEHVAFHVDDFSHLLNTNPPADPKNGVYPQALYDESGYGLFAKDWMHEWVKEVGKALQVVGKKQNTCYFILPHLKKLVGDIRDEMAFFWIDVDFGIKHKRGYAEVYKGNRNKFKQAIWWNPKCCFKYDELDDEFWQAYEKLKDQFINDVASGKYEMGKTAKDTERFNRALFKLTQHGESADDLADEFGIGRSTVYRRLTTHKSTIGNGDGGG